MEEDADDDALHLDVLRIRIDRVDAFQQVQHLPGVVQQTAGECMMYTRGSRILAVLWKENVCLFTDETDELFILAETDERFQRGIPHLLLHRAWHQLVQGVILRGERAGNHVHVCCRLLALIVANVEETHQLSHLGTTRLWHIKHTDVFHFLIVRNLQVHVG